jgi:hypothetical protein
VLYGEDTDKRECHARADVQADDCAGERLAADREIDQDGRHQGDQQVSPRRRPAQYRTENQTGSYADDHFMLQHDSLQGPIDRRVIDLEASFPTSVAANEIQNNLDRLWVLWALSPRSTWYNITLFPFGPSCIHNTHLL